MEGNRIILWKDAPPQGAEIYRNNDFQFEQLLFSAKETRKIPVFFTLKETENGFRLLAEDVDGNRASFAAEAEHVLASNPSVSENLLQEQIGKTGNTIFEAVNVSVSFSRPWFIRTSLLNEMRRQCLDSLLRERLKNYQRAEKYLVKNEVVFPETSIDYRANVINRKSEVFFRRHGVKEIQSGFDLNPLPSASLMTMKFCPKFELGKCPKFQDKKAGKGDWFLAEGNNRFRLVFHCNECIVTLHKE